jgi:hypothetical protein
MDNFVGAGVLPPLLAYLEIPLRAQLIDLGKHPCQQLFRRGCADPGSLKVTNFPPLPLDLAAPVLDLDSELIKLHDDLAPLTPLQFHGALQSSRGLPFQEAATGSIA